MGHTAIPRSLPKALLWRWLTPPPCWEAEQGEAGLSTWGPRSGGNDVPGLSLVGCPCPSVTPGFRDNRGAWDLARAIEVALEETIFAENRRQNGTRGLSATKIIGIETKQRNAAQEGWRKGHDMKHRDMLCPQRQPRPSVCLGHRPWVTCGQLCQAGTCECPVRPGLARRADGHTAGHADSRVWEEEGTPATGRARCGAGAGW